MTLHMNEACGFSKRRNYMKYLYIILSVWTLILVYVNMSDRQIFSHQQDMVGDPETKPKENIFEKWHESNYRSLMGVQRSVEYVRGLERKFKASNQTSVSDAILNVDELSNKKKEIGIDFLNSLFFDKDDNVPEVSCERVLDGNPKEIASTKLALLELNSKKYKEKKKILLSSDEHVTEMANNCEEFKFKRKYILSPLSSEEKGYPIAYVFTIHRDLVSFEQLLRSIYHPQNIYCVHVDSKSDEKFHSSVASITGCFENVFIASTLTEVSYAHWTRVQADINCLKDLVKKKDEYPWSYVINLCGQDFPTKTNFEIVRALKSLSGFNSLETIHTPPHKTKRYEFQYVLPKSPKGDHDVMKKTSIKKTPPPGNIEMFAGGAYFVFKREAVEYMMNDSIVQEFFKWNEDSYSPDEHMWATLQRMYPQMPGSIPPHSKYDTNELQTISRTIKWAGLDKAVYPKCEGSFRRGVCVYGCGDLAWLTHQHQLFANKFDREVDVLAIHCIDNYIRNRTITEGKLRLLRGYL